ncbi:MAG: glycogen/starch synthase [Armatimonadota bacterium]
MRILIVSAEKPTAARVGRPADFAHALASGLNELGHDARVALPAYRFVEEDARLNVRPVLENLVLDWDDGSIRTAYVQSVVLGEVYFYLIGDGRRFRHAGRLDGEDCGLLARGVLAALRNIRPRWLPELVHINDSCPGLAAVYLNAIYLREWDIQDTSFVTTVHGEADFRRANTLVTGTRLDPDVRVVRRYRSARRLAKEYESIYSEVLSHREMWRMAA